MVSALLTLHKEWMKAIDRIEVNLLMEIDMSAVFDMVYKDILNRKMEFNGMDSSETDWMWSYMSYFSQLVQIEGY